MRKKKGLMDKDKKIEMWAILGTNFAIVALVIALFTWNRTESNADRRDMMAMIRSIDMEMKDFHGRLCAIEQSKK
jgi:hypothetical protein